MDWTDLKERTGAGTTLTGELLAPETVRRMACDAAIIPAVLGAKSEVLDLGRTVPAGHAQAVPGAVPARPRLHLPRLFATPGLVRRAPLVHWCEGGPTDLSNMALVCPRHHTIVHQKGYTATISATGVTWHL